MVLVSILIATSARRKPLQDTLRSLHAVRVPAEMSVELIVVENGGEPGSLETPGLHIPIRHIHVPAPGKAQALNAALAKARGEILLFTDDDVRFPPDWLEKACAPILEGRADAVAGGVRLAPCLMRSWMTRRHRACLASTADYIDPDMPSEMCGANMALHRRALDAAGGFDPELGPGVTNGGEESLLSWQIKRAGLRLVGVPAVQVEHHPSPDRLTYGNWIKVARLSGYTHAYLLHHWNHRVLRFPRLVRAYLQFKLAARRSCTPRFDLNNEGIPPWELSYLEDISMYTRYLVERRRPHNYPRDAIRKVTANPPPSFA